MRQEPRNSVRNSEYAVGLETDETSLEQGFEGEATQRPSSYSATKGKISVHSIGVSVEELWGEGKKTPSLVFTDPSGQEFISRFKPLEAITSVITSKLQRSVWRHLFSAFQIAPGPVLASVAFVCVRSAVMLSLLSLLCVFIERIFAPTQASLMYRFDSASQPLPRLLLESLASVQSLLPALSPFLGTAVQRAWRIFSHYRPALPVLIMAIGPLFVEVYLRPHLMRYLRRSLSYDQEDSNDLSIVWNFCNIVGNTLTILILATLSTTFKLDNLRNILVTVLTFSLVELMLLKEMRYVDDPDLFYSLQEAKDQRSQIVHLESIVSGKESREYVQRWSLLPAVEDLIVSLKSSLRKLNRSISGRLPNYNLSHMRRLLLSIVAILFCVDSHMALSDAKLLKNYRVMTDRLVNAVRYFYYGYGVELYEEDDSRLHRHFFAMLTILDAFLPLQLMTSIFNSCADLTQAITEHAIASSMRLLPPHGEPSSNQGWTSGAISSAGAVFDEVSLHADGYYSVQVRDINRNIYHHYVCRSLALKSSRVRSQLYAVIEAVAGMSS